MASRALTGRSRALVASGLVVTFAVALTGCGVSTTGPTDVGDAAVTGASAADGERREPPSPDSADSAEGLVNDYLKAAVGGGKPAIDQVRAFLNEHALESWVNPVNPDNPQLTVIRVVRGPTTGASTANRTPVTVEYQKVGVLNDQGRVEELADVVTQSMTFWVVPDRNDARTRRIDEIDDAPPGLLLSDAALADDYYRVQPIYFWDPTFSALVPDVRYVPLTLTPDVRASRLVEWLVAGPSSWLPNLQRLPTGIGTVQAVTENGTLVVKLSSQAALDPDSLQRLYWQLQWTLRTPTLMPTLKLRIDDKDVSVPGGSDDYLRFNASYNFRGLAQRYDIQEGRVIAVMAAAPSPTGALASAENQSVVSAAVTRGGAAAAFVRDIGLGRRSLSIVRDGRLIGTNLQTTSVGRPAFIPNSDDSLLIAAAGRLYAVSGTDGVATDVTRGAGGVTAVAVAPDGRRLAFVANRQVYVTSLTLANNTITVGSTVRPILGGLVEANSVAWTSAAWLDVAGTATTGGPALWRVTADSVVAQNLSDKLIGVTVLDLLAYPQWPTRVNTDVLAITDRGVYTFFSNLAPATDLKAPFFGL